MIAEIEARKAEVVQALQGRCPTCGGGVWVSFYDLAAIWESDRNYFLIKPI